MQFPENIKNVIKSKKTGTGNEPVYMNRTFKNYMKKRLLFVVLVVLGVLVFLVSRMVSISHGNNEEYAQNVYDNLRYKNQSILAKRGEITDRTGTTLAYSERVYNLILDPKEYWTLKEDEDKEKNITAIVENFGLDRGEILELFNQYKGTTTAYVKVLTDLSESQVISYKDDIAQNGKYNCSWLEADYKRIYPYGSLAAPLIGFASESSGVIGVENQYNAYLTGTNGREYGYVGDDANLETVVKPAINGDSVKLTIDWNVQRIVEQKLEEFNEEFGSKKTAFIMMNPNNGEILSMAQYPTFDLNAPKNVEAYYTDEEMENKTEEEQVEAYYDVWSNYCVSHIYEPGSVFKTFTISEGLEDGIQDGSEVYMCDGSETVMGVKINCAHTEGHGLLTLSEALEESCNDALMQIVAPIGIDRFSTFIRRLNFGSKTGIDLPGEEEGILYKADAMTALDLATNCFGQNLNVTMVQQAAAFSSIINGGTYYIPHVVKEIKSEAGDVVVKNEGTALRETISKSTSDIMRGYLRNVVDYGTGSYLQCAGYDIGGKTGAAEKQPRDKMHYLISFIGFMPVEDPQVVFYVVIDEPNVEDYYSSRAAQILAHDIIVELMPYLEIYQTRPLEIPETEGIHGEADNTEVNIPDASAGTDNASPSDNAGTSEGESSGESQTEAVETPAETPPADTVADTSAEAPSETSGE